MAWTDPPLWAWIFFLSEWAIRLAMLVVIPFRRTPTAAKAWLLLLFFEPWVGLLLYLLIGRARLPRRRREQLAELPGAMAGVVSRLTNQRANSKSQLNDKCNIAAGNNAMLHFLTLEFQMVYRTNATIQPFLKRCKTLQNVACVCEQHRIFAV